MVDSVELHQLDQVEKVRKFHRVDRIACQQRGDALDEIVNVRHVRQHVGGADQVRLFALRGQALGQVFAEELHQGRHALLFGLRRGVAGGLDPQHRHACLHEILQQIAIVGGDFHHQALGPKLQFRRHLLCIGFAVGEP